MDEAQVKIGKAKPFRCVVTSDKMDKSRVGTVERLVKHARYNKYIRRRTKLMFHDEKNETQIGDTVLISHSKTFSNRKKFELTKIEKKAVE